MAISVFIVDDHAMVRQGMAQVIKLEEDLCVVGDGTGSSETLDAVRRTQTRVAVVDLEMPVVRGADFINLVKHNCPETKALVCSMHASYGYVAEALRRGADGYVLKSSPSAMLIDGIRRVAAGQGFIDPALQVDVIKLLQSRDQGRGAMELTVPETEVLRLAAEGCSNVDIAHRTRQSVETVKLRLRRSFQKLGAADRANAVALALRRNLIQ